MVPIPLSPPRRASRRSAAVLALAAAALAPGSTHAAAEEKRPDAAAEELPTVAARTAGLEPSDGLVATWLDRRRGKLWLELPPPAPDSGGEIGRFLYAASLGQGLGSNPVGLDRGLVEEGRVLRLRRLGPRLLIEQLNLRYRADSADPDERRAVDESFATSVLWAAPLSAEDPDGRALVDLTPFLVRDALGLAATLAATGQGTYQLDAERSALDPDAFHSFPDNLETEAVLTFAYQGGYERGADGAEGGPGEQVRETVPAPESVTLRQHHSLVRLPDDGYRPRAFHPQSGFFPGAVAADYASPLDEPLERRWIARHRLVKTDPAAARSPVIEPIVFYLDPGVPEPVRSALADGAGWWAEAFEALGYEDAFRVELLPSGAHPLDVRYHVIHWTHRSTRGWSYGGGVIDPRTGEIVKGAVNLGSLRVRQDRLIFEGLLGADRTGTGADDDPIELALARLRQLAAHEVGHALGLSHNFAASGYGRASVMDYPAPWITLGADGELDASGAYAVGLGAWDLQAIRYGYSTLPPGADEEAELAEILADGRRRGLLLLGDSDARPPGAPEPRAALWDNGDDPVAALEEVMAVRRHALDRFGERNVAPGTPLALLQETLAPIYLYHRYQVEATAKLVGGFEYYHAHRGEDGGEDGGALTPVDPERQRRALAALLTTLDPAALDLPEPLLRRLLPRPLGYPAHRELFAGAADPGFDPLAAAASAADLTLRAVLQPQRAARLVDLHRRDPRSPGLAEVIDRVVAATFGASAAAAAPEPDADPRRPEIRRAVQWAAAGALVDLAAGSPSPAVRSRAEEAVRALVSRLESEAATAAVQRGHQGTLAAELRRFLDRPASAVGPRLGAHEPPPGAPIGGARGRSSGEQLGSGGWRSAPAFGACGFDP